MSLFQNPAVKDAREIKGAWVLGSTNSMELQTVVGIGYNVDLGIKFSPLFPLTVVEKKRRYPIDVDMKYQILKEPLYVSAGLGWSNLVTRNRNSSNRLRSQSEAWRSYLLVGTKFLYTGITTNYITSENPFNAGETQEYVLPTKKLFFSYTAGISIGKAFRINPEITMLPTKGVFRTVWGVSFEFTGLFNL